ncbi:hypothetical protein L596_008520 [Steinernema carpocapsae]|uniref:LsmAD domain-containing protein n=1 Tax=Steinernema carpocapsae TaxID=34508 RepID=A0A4U5PCR5_STECR|nr:hypothetical protein L596_008520 [Steinernema carpocapsae]
MPQRSSASALKYVTGNAFTLNTVHDMIGREVLLETNKGDRYEGIFAAYGKDREVGLQSAYKLPKDGEPERLLPLRSETQKIIFPSTEYVTISLVMNDDKRMREFAIDADYHDRKIEANGGQLDDFEEWHDDDHGNGELGGDIEEISSCNGGWAVQDMFKQNGSLVKSDFLDDLSQYTTVEVGQVSDEARERAEQIAQDIESNAGSRRMQLLENDDEERDLDKATEFENNIKDYIPCGRRPNRGMRGNVPPAQRGGPSMRGNRGGGQYNNNMQNFSNASHSQQYGGNRGEFQNRQGNPNASRYGGDRQRNGSMSSSDEPWKQQNPSASQRRPVEPTPVGSYSAVVAAGRKQSSPVVSNDVRMSSGNAPPSRIVETGAAVAEKAQAGVDRYCGDHSTHNNRRTDDLKNWGSDFYKSYVAVDDQNQNAPSSAHQRTGNARQSGPLHCGKNPQGKPSSDDAPTHPENKPEPKKLKVEPVVAQKDPEKPKIAEEAEAAEVAVPATNDVSSEPATEGPAAKSEEPVKNNTESKFKFNPNAASFVPKFQPPQPAVPPTTVISAPNVMPMVQMPMMPGQIPPQMVVNYGGHQVQNYQMMYPTSGQIFTVPSQFMPPQSQPQQSGTHTPNGSQTGIPSGTPSVPSGPPQAYTQYPQGMSQQQMYSAQQQAQQQPPTSTVVMPMVPMVPMMPGGGPPPHMMVMNYGGPHQGQNHQMMYPGGHQIFTVQSSYMQPQSQPQQSGTQTPNGSQTGMPSGGQSVQSGPVYGQYQQGMQQQPMYSHH